MVNDKWRVIRVHSRTGTHKIVYEHYDPEEHAIYYTYLNKTNVVDGFKLHPEMTLNQYLTQTDWEYL